MFLASYETKLALLELKGKKYNKTIVLIKDIVIKVVLTTLITLTLIF